MSKTCGACHYFTKWKKDKIGGGLCEFCDCRTKTDLGHGCKDFKGKRYKRDKSKINVPVDKLV